MACIDCPVIKETGVEKLSQSFCHLFCPYSNPQTKNMQRPIICEHGITHIEEF